MAAPRRSAREFVVASGRAGGLGRPVRHRSQPAARGPARWRTHPLRADQRKTSLDLHRRSDRVASAGLVFLDGLVSLGGASLGDRIPSSAAAGRLGAARPERAASGRRSRWPSFFSASCPRRSRSDDAFSSDDDFSKQVDRVHVQQNGAIRNLFLGAKRQAFRQQRYGARRAAAISAKIGSGIRA